MVKDPCTLKVTVQNERYLQEDANHSQAVILHESFFKTCKFAAIPVYQVQLGVKKKKRSLTMIREAKGNRNYFLPLSNLTLTDFHLLGCQRSQMFLVPKRTNQKQRSYSRPDNS